MRNGRERFTLFIRCLLLLVCILALAYAMFGHKDTLTEEEILAQAKETAGADDGESGSGTDTEGEETESAAGTGRISDMLGEADGDAGETETETEPEEPGHKIHVRNFTYTYFGSMDGNYTYEVKSSGRGSATLSYEDQAYYEYGKMSMTVGSEFISGLDALFRDFDLQTWNGFDESDPNVDDGSGFSLSVSLSDESRVWAGGSNAWPDGYGGFEERMQELFEPRLIELRERRRKEFSRKEIKGDLEHLIASITEHGESGQDRYSFVIKTHETGKVNFNVQIHEPSRAFFDKDYSFYLEVPDELLDMKKIDDLSRLYKITRWYNWDKTEGDTDNTEYFCMQFGYEGGVLNFQGNVPPKNYEEFRDKLLPILAKIVKRVDEAYPGSNMAESVD